LFGGEVLESAEVRMTKPKVVEDGRIGEVPTRALRWRGLGGESRGRRESERIEPGFIKGETAEGLSSGGVGEVTKSLTSWERSRDTCLLEF
jgi:hypothetical protein